MRLPRFLYRWVTDADLTQYASRGELLRTDHVGSFPGENTHVQVELSTFTIGNAKNKTKLTVEDYLSTKMGAGGNVVGTFEYIEHWSQTKKNNNAGYNDMAMTKIHFGANRHLVIFPMAKYSGPPMLEAFASLTEDIVPCPGYLKVAQLGSLMATTRSYGQEAEWNLIPGEPIALPAIIVKIGEVTATKDFILNASAPISISKLIGVVKTIAPPPSDRIDLDAVPRINISECPGSAGGTRPRTRTSRRRRTHRALRSKRGRSTASRSSRRYR